MSFSPISASRTIADKYTRYLSTVFDLADDDYREQFHNLLKNEHLFEKGPYLDVSDSFVKGKSVGELINEGKLAKGFSTLVFPMDRKLHKHQEISLEKIQAGRNVVVSTGTGSGKTECFLLPILNELVREHEAGTLSPGVRALLIYPMNALANDQIERLRKLLKDTPDITFGAYTGQTEELYKDALKEYKELNEGNDPLENELISREQMKKEPPHLLITNYAMLEYLMVRPDDSVFFDDGRGDTWRYIVLDEAHVYNGSTGIEVSMLLRRLRARLENDRIQYILTSATLGGEDSDRDVVTFAGNLCGAEFTPEDVIRARREKASIPVDAVPIPKAFYKEVAQALASGEDDEAIAGILRSHSYPVSGETAGEMLFPIVLKDQRYGLIRALLERPRTVTELCMKTGLSEEELGDFVDVASVCENNGMRLFDARYHFFLRATESIFITLPPDKSLFLNRRQKRIAIDGREYKAFEAATCSFCHCLYLTGKVRNDILEQTSMTDSSEETPDLFLLSENASDTDEDHLLEDEKAKTEPYEICAFCGHVHKKGSRNSCPHGHSALVPVQRVIVDTPTKTLTKCPHCEQVNSTGVLRRFFSGQDAVTSVIGTSLFESLPGTCVVHERKAKDENDPFEDPFDTEEAVNEHIERIAKQFIAFSDSRQGAAYFATYFDQTYRNILNKRLIVEVLAQLETEKSVSFFANKVAALMAKYDIGSLEERTLLAEKAILKEITDSGGTTSLSSFGMISFRNAAQLPPLPKLGLSETDVNEIAMVFLLGMMSDAAIQPPEGINLSDADKEDVAPGGVFYTYNESVSKQKKYERSFIPSQMKYSNKRFDYLTRVLERGNGGSDRDKVTGLLRGYWNQLDSKNLICRDSKREGYRVNLDKITILKPEKLYRCPRCNKLTAHNVRGVCPTYRCPGILEVVDPSRELEGNHYYEMYRTLDIRDMRIVEHTAQLDRKTAYDYQKKFINKEIDILSCSTTFEMGVDVGSLETVFMRNMPPSPANYAQRAGRAGRSRKAAAYAVTFCNKSNHDFSFFERPVDMIKGQINPPLFRVDNEKIAIRHLYASVFALFWKRYQQYFDVIQIFVNKDQNGKNGVDLLRDYLDGKPEEVRDYLLRFLPQELIQKFGVETFGWVTLLLNDPEENAEGEIGALTGAIRLYKHELDTLDREYERISKEKGNTGRISEQRRTLIGEPILSFLSRKNVMPKYGFPVDTVEMTLSVAEGNKLGLQLQRDLALAISEYAPGSQIVANGKLITSRYVRKVPYKGWRMYDYKRCRECRSLNTVFHPSSGTPENPASIEQLSLSNCKQCGAVLDDRSQTFLIPEFGFIADKIGKPTLRKPDRTYRGRVSFVGNREALPMEKIEFGRAVVEVGTKRNEEMAVLNESNFFICETCGYAEVRNEDFHDTIKQHHKSSAGYSCQNEKLGRYSLGSRFLTDVTLIRFIDPLLTDYNVAQSVLWSVIKGTCSYLTIEEGDIMGCVDYFRIDESNIGGYSLILYDTTPGGAGHVKRILEPEALKGCLREALRLMNYCDCTDSSCYTCLRSYRNQRDHDLLRKDSVVNFLGFVQ